MFDIPGWEQKTIKLESQAELIFEVDSSRYGYWIVLEGYACATIQAVSIDLDPGQMICVPPHSSASLYNRGVGSLKVLMTVMEIVKKKV